MCNTKPISNSCWHVMVEIQLSQMSVAKLTTRFRLQACLGVIINDYVNQALSVFINDR